MKTQPATGETYPKSDLFNKARKWVSRLAWLITVIYSSVPLAYLCGIYPYSSWPTIAANIMILVVLLSVRGNVARLVDVLRH
ncbi:phage holin family protein [Klebsiella pneumoniae]|uniref:phage holin family protein n=1 Tax=Klebsiella pneumoniae TaxID=573 RepID=UPI0015E0B41E|nr:phage holin family protein [Klebsiella pneumoniae]